MAALEASQPEPSKQAKRKLDDDDQVIALFQNLIAGTAADNDDNKDRNEDNADNTESSVDTHWIERWIDKPAGE